MGGAPRADGSVVKLASAPASASAAAVALAALCASCSTPSSPSPPPPAAGLTIACPAPVSAQSADGGPVAVTYSSPVADGGTAPLTTTCVPPSGSAFPLGGSTVTCTARDSAQQSAVCSFAVTVTKTPTLSVNRIDAFGDSITEGTVSSCSGLTATSGIRPPWQMLRFDGVVDPARSYPTRLQAMLRARYTAQAPEVANDGRAGERTDEGVERIRTVLAERRPQAMLLLEGANDVNQGVPRFDIALNVRDMARRSREAGAQAVFVATLLPQRAGACKAYGADRISSTNESIRAMVAAEGFTLVDLETAFAGRDDLLGPDGLHPSEAGYELIATAFFDALRARFEQ
jgi:acyl-CoA thioesterase-1